MLMEECTELLILDKAVSASVLVQGLEKGKGKNFDIFVVLAIFFNEIDVEIYESLWYFRLFKHVELLMVYGDTEVVDLEMNRFGLMVS